MSIAQTDILHHPDFLAHVGHYAAKATAALPAANGRVVKAVALVLAGGVEAVGAGRWTVASQSNYPERWYDVARNTCTCDDYEHHATHTNGYACKHVMAIWLYRRAVQAIEKEEIMSIPDNTCTVALDTDGVPCHAVNAVCPGHTILQEFIAADSITDHKMTPSTLAWDFSTAAPPRAPIPAALPEAPVSLNCYIWMQGHKVQLTLRGTDVAEVLQKMSDVLTQYAPADGK